MDEISLNFLIVAIFYLVPILLVILFIIFLFAVTFYRYLSARKKTPTPFQMKSLRSEKGNLLLLQFCSELCSEL